MNKKFTVSKRQNAERENQMNFFVLLSVVKKLCKTILYTHIVELFPFLVPTRIKENYKNK